MATARKQISLEGLIQRATSGRKFNRHELFRPSLSYYLVKDPFWLWCEHHAPKQEAVDETTRYDELRMQQGVEYEQHWVKTHYPNAVAIEPSFSCPSNLPTALVGSRARYLRQRRSFDSRRFVRIGSRPVSLPRG